MALNGISWVWQAHDVAQYMRCERSSYSTSAKEEVVGVPAKEAGVCELEG